MTSNFAFECPPVLLGFSHQDIGCLIHLAIASPRCSMQLSKCCPLDLPVHGWDELQGCKDKGLTSGTALTAPTMLEDSHKAMMDPPAYTRTVVLFSTLSHCMSKLGVLICWVLNRPTTEFESMFPHLQELAICSCSKRVQHQCQETQLTAWTCKDTQDFGSFSSYNVATASAAD